MPEKGWLDRQFWRVSRETDSWPEWLRREVGLEEDNRQLVDEYEDENETETVEA